MSTTCDAELRPWTESYDDVGDDAPSTTGRWRRRLLTAVATTAALLAASPMAGTLVPQLPVPFSYVVVSGTSMEPAMSSGDIALVRRKWSGYAEGDVIAYRVPAGDVGAGGAVIHRIIDGSGSGYVTRGDNRSGQDLWRPRDRDVIGSTFATLPRVGGLLAELRTTTGLAVMAALLTMAATNRMLRGRDETAR